MSNPGGTGFALTELLSPGLKTLGDSDFGAGAQPSLRLLSGRINVKSLKVCISSHPAIQTQVLLFESAGDYSPAQGGEE